MPNHITNQITFGNDEKSMDTFRQMLEDMRSPGKPLGTFDFNKLLPMPESLDIEAGSRTQRGLELLTEYHNALETLEHKKSSLSPETYSAKLKQCEALYRKRRIADPESWSLGEQAYRNIRQYGAPTWYEWCNRNWGTKWNAYDCQPLCPDSDTIIFCTAWSSVPEMIKLLSQRYPEQTVIYRWADEDIGHNVGELTYKDGAVTDINIPAAGSRDAYEMAAEILEINLSDFNLYLTKDGCGYEYRDPDDFPREQNREKEKGRGFSR